MKPVHTQDEILTDEDRQVFSGMLYDPGLAIELDGMSAIRLERGAGRRERPTIFDLMLTAQTRSYEYNVARAKGRVG